MASKRGHVLGISIRTSRPSQRMTDVGKARRARKEIKATLSVAEARVQLSKVWRLKSWQEIGEWWIQALGPVTLRCDNYMLPNLVFKQIALGCCPSISGITRQKHLLTHIFSSCTQFQNFHRKARTHCRSFLSASLYPYTSLISGLY